MKVQKLKINKGITLVALIMTIVILLILASISISTITRNGIFKQAQEAKIQSKRSQIIEWLGLKLIEEQSSYMKSNLQIIEATKENIEKNINELERIGKINEIGDVKTEENGEITEPYFFATIDNDVYKVENSGVKFVGEDGTVPSKITGLTDKNTIFSYSTKEWTNKNVTVTVTTTEEKYTIQTSTDGKKWTNSNSQVFEKNGIIYARLTDGKNSGKMYCANITNIDKEAPNMFEPTITSTTNKITLVANTTDIKQNATNGESGIDGYRFSKDGGKNWTEYQTSGTYIFDNMLKDINGSTYNIVVQARDKAQNVTITKTVQATTEKNMKYYVKGANTLLCTILNKEGNKTRAYYKYKEDGAIAAMAYTDTYGRPNGDESYGIYTWLHPIIVSTTEDGAKYYGDTVDTWYNTYIEKINKIEYNGVQYYYNYGIGMVTLKMFDGFYNYKTSLITLNESTNPFNGKEIEKDFKEAALELIKRYLNE